MANSAYKPPLRPENYPGSTAERRAQQGEVIMVIDILETQQEQAVRARDRLRVVESALQKMFQVIYTGLKSAPDGPVTEVTAQQIDSFFQTARDAARCDPRAGVVAAPAARPVTRRALAAALRQALEAIMRCSAGLTERQALLADRLAQAYTISTALTVAENGRGFVLSDEVARMGVAPHPDWFFDFDSGLAPFNFQKLNHTAIERYFCQDL